VDTKTGYRYYSAHQLPQLNRILVLKELGLSLDEIGRILQTHPGPGELRGMLALRRAEVERDIAAAQRRLQGIEARIAQLDEVGALEDDDVVVRQEPERMFFGARVQVRSFAAARVELERAHAAVAQHVGSRGLGPMVVVAHGEDYEPDALDLELGHYVTRPVKAHALPDGTPLRLRTLDAVAHMATCVRVGSPERAHLATGRILGVVARTGQRLAGASREVFVQPFDPTHPERAVVEMQFPLSS